MTLRNNDLKHPADSALGLRYTIEYVRLRQDWVGSDRHIVQECLLWSFFPFCVFSATSSLFVQHLHDGCDRLQHLLEVYYWSTNQVIVQRALAARSLADGQKGVLFAASMPLGAPWCNMGLFMAIVLPTTLLLTHPNSQPLRLWPWNIPT